MDAARTAIRLGADVTVLYRKTQEEMPAIQSEYEDAVKEGVKFEWKTTVEAFLKGKNGRLGSCVLNTPEGERVEKFTESISPSVQDLPTVSFLPLPESRWMRRDM